MISAMAWLGEELAALAQENRTPVTRCINSVIEERLNLRSICVQPAEL
jgi:hypothetical protein